MTWGQLMAFTREQFTDDPRRAGSILKALIRRFGPQETEYMVRGAALLGWKSIISLNAREGIGRRWALARFWDGEKRSARFPESVKSIMREASK